MIQKIIMQNTLKNIFKKLYTWKRGDFQIATTKLSIESFSGIYLLKCALHIDNH